MLVLLQEREQDRRLSNSRPNPRLTSELSWLLLQRLAPDVLAELGVAAVKETTKGVWGGPGNGGLGSHFTPTHSSFSCDHFTRKQRLAAICRLRCLKQFKG